MLDLLDKLLGGGKSAELGLHGDYTTSTTDALVTDIDRWGVLPENPSPDDVLQMRQRRSENEGQLALLRQYSRESLANGRAIAGKIAAIQQHKIGMQGINAQIQKGDLRFNKAAIASQFNTAGNQVELTAYQRVMGEAKGMVRF